ncbi:MAG TPA: response regulator [Polyangia bacterium]|jgi:CheY-like chemotaxis protein|nr:response regulator [Polyangia bacterium]
MAEAMNALDLSCHSILVVDDDSDIRETLTDILSEEGYRVTGVRNGREALAYLGAQTRPSLILLDMMMPEMDGWRFRQEQQRNPVIAGIPVVILSAHGNVREAALALGVADYLRKPLRVENLLEIAERYCRPVFLN